jgi:hypothetical protein
MNRFDDNIWAKIEEHLSEKSKNKCATANLPAPFAKIIRATRVMQSALFRADVDNIAEQFRATDAMLTSAKNRQSTMTKTAAKLEAMGFRYDPTDYVVFEGHVVTPNSVRINNEFMLTSSPKGMLYFTKIVGRSIGDKIHDLRVQKHNLRLEHMAINVAKARAASEAAMDDLCGDSDDEPMQ